MTFFLSIFISFRTAFTTFIVFPTTIFFSIPIIRLVSIISSTIIITSTSIITTNFIVSPILMPPFLHFVVLCSFFHRVLFRVIPISGHFASQLFTIDFQRSFFVQNESLASFYYVRFFALCVTLASFLFKYFRNTSLSTKNKIHYILLIRFWTPSVSIHTFLLVRLFGKPNKRVASVLSSFSVTAQRNENIDDFPEILEILHQIVWTGHRPW